MIFQHDGWWLDLASFIYLLLCFRPRSCSVYPTRPTSSADLTSAVSKSGTWEASSSYHQITRHVHVVYSLTSVLYSTPFPHVNQRNRRITDSSLNWRLWHPKEINLLAMILWKLRHIYKRNLWGIVFYSRWNCSTIRLYNSNFRHIYFLRLPQFEKRGNILDHNTRSTPDTSLLPCTCI